ncbi:single-stranded-DNA-specific exonuclease RecJ [Patescibacteria group bacterium]|nr:single-stranded-DNA-specific exonuclease RecJ [Patescibacteria group bacterium]MBU0801763.1 single-stranded-DNA-specific exonuclease RecJ [Alphaproteobacteria bacterium]MBU1754747.1 single-stranded-DNA-specific exonuclease RecJ [Patescibacteria group bacterium]
MFHTHDPIDTKTRDALKEFDDLTAALLARRGFHTAEEAHAFLNPSYEEQINDPLLIKNMPKAAERVASAIDSKERIGVWSDYDCDGIPGGVLFHDFLKKAGANFTNYIPHRHNEGFGLNIGGIDTLKADGVSLIITIDCGIADVEQVAYAQSIGIDVIVTDHHLPGELPPAFAVVDPKQEGETCAFQEYCGAGLAWKLACAILAVGFKDRDTIPVGWEKWLLDMAGLATIADMVPLIGENRVIARYGLLVMRKSPRLGLQKLCSVARVNQRTITEDDVGFMIAPRINAASRMGTPMDAFKLLTTTDETEADLLSKELEKINRSRKASGAAVTRKAHEKLETLKLEGDLPEVIVLGDPDWRPGLLGLVANSLAEEYQRPVFLWGREGTGTPKGSCRAGRKEVSVVELMNAASDAFIEGGGHAASGGFSLADDQVFDLEEKLNKAFASLPKKDMQLAEQFADAEFVAGDSASRLLVAVEKLAPFGMANPKPAFLVRNVSLQEVSWFGKSGEHLRIKFSPEGNTFRSDVQEAISFFARRELGDATLKLEEGNVATLLVHIERDQFMRRPSVRMRVVGIG